MSKLPHSADPSLFVGCTLIEVDPKENILYLRFLHPGNKRQLSLGVECEWEVRNPAREVVQRGSAGSSSPRLTVQSAVQSAQAVLGRALELVFEDGQVLEVKPSEGPYESFCFPELNIHV